MALTKTARNKINSLVQRTKKLLMEEVENQLQQYYGIRPDGSAVAIELLTSNDPGVIHKAELLRQRLAYLQSNIPEATTRAKESFYQLVREQAFTILNRFASLRMAEERDIIRESVRQGYNSEGFLVFDELTGKGKTAELYKRYTWYLFAIFDELAQDLPAVFDRYSPYAILFPGEATLLKLLDIINDEDINIFREEGFQPINLWKEDETIGWIYQYYNSREEITAMREASNAPRNSRELAVRNQFFTPRYVVQFLTDNSLGRIWYEMTKGDTNLVDFCEYLVRQPKEVFLLEGEQKPVDADEHTVYVEHRPLKDPREISMIDPACGSMHFGLYAFDLYEKIYLECWDRHRDLIRPIIDEYVCVTKEAYAALIPSLIIRHNIHGVDIDARAVQIAGLSLWLRAQKSYQLLKLEPKDRPAITKANIVCAEPMPGDQKMILEFLQSIDQPLRPLVSKIWQKMQLAGEMGLLLKIEEELKTTIEEAKKNWEAYQDKINRMGKDLGIQADLFEDAAVTELREQKVIYQNIRADFFDQAEGLVLNALEQYAESATNGTAYQKHLFAEDTARGFAFIDLCRKSYDILLMNPPFGSESLNSRNYLQKYYSESNSDICSMFVDRTLEILANDGLTGVISNRTIFFLSSFKEFRKKFLLEEHSLSLFVDLGSGILDAMVETAMYIIQRKPHPEKKASFFNLTKKDLTSKKYFLGQIIKRKEKEYFSEKSLKLFYNIPNISFSYWLENTLLIKFNSLKSFEKKYGFAKVGLQTGDDFRFIRLWTEVVFNSGLEKKWLPLAKGGEFAPFFNDITLVVNWNNEGKEIKNFINLNTGKLRSRPQNIDHFFNPGITWSRRTSRDVSFRILPKGCVFSDKGPSAFVHDILGCLGVMQSENFRDLISAQLAAVDGAARSYEVGIIQNTPVPNKLSDKVKLLVIQIIELKRKRFQTTEISHDFFRPGLAEFGLLSLEEKTKKLIKDFNVDQQKIQQKEIELNEEVNKLYDDFYPDNLAKAISDNNPKIDLQQFYKNEIHKLLSWCFGVLFGRWDVRLCKHRIDLKALLDPLNELPSFSYGQLKSLQDEYPIPIFSNGLVSNEIYFSKRLDDIFNFLWGENVDSLKNELLGTLSISNISDYFSSPNNFFEYHLKNYSQNRRQSPIYWPLSTVTNKFLIWIYYPILNDQTLYQIVNDFINPKTEQVQKEISLLTEYNETNKTIKELKDTKIELINFKEEILKVAQLPYKPNHDDGVLITAAPLHKLFRHTKWRKATEECWNKLKAGEYDWAHLAYSIWPDRVREKCKKDLSLAIAHGLEDICEIKPREKKTRKKKKSNTPKQLKIDDI